LSNVSARSKQSRASTYSRDVDADVSEPAVRVAEIVLHIDHEDRCAFEVEGHGLRRRLYSQAAQRGTTANEIDVRLGDAPLVEAARP
jgi:hypothetical protein